MNIWEEVQLAWEEKSRWHNNSWGLPKKQNNHHTFWLAVAIVDVTLFFLELLEIKLECVSRLPMVEFMFGLNVLFTITLIFLESEFMDLLSKSELLLDWLDRNILNSCTDVEVQTLRILMGVTEGILASKTFSKGMCLNEEVLCLISWEKSFLSRLEIFLLFSEFLRPSGGVVFIWLLSFWMAASVVSGGIVRCHIWVSLCDPSKEMFERKDTAAMRRRDLWRWCWEITIWPGDGQPRQRSYSIAGLSGYYHYPNY